MSKGVFENIFPITVGIIEIDKDHFAPIHDYTRPWIQEHLDYIKKENLLNYDETVHNKFNASTDGETSFYGPNLVGNTKFNPIIGLIHDNLQQYLSTISSKNVNILIQNCWFTVYKEGQFIPRHTHPTSQFSLAYYFNAQNNCGDLVFHDPIGDFRTHFDNNRCPVPELNNPNTFSVTPSDGMIVFFPSWLPHNSLPNHSGQDRIIFSLNFFVE